MTDFELFLLWAALAVLALALFGGGGAHMKLQHWAALIGLCQLVGQALGSTTLAGAVCYEAVTAAWWIWMCCGRQWGFLPLNVGGAVISSYTLWGVI